MADSDSKTDSRCTSCMAAWDIVPRGGGGGGGGGVCVCVCTCMYVCVCLCAHTVAQMATVVVCSGIMNDT